MTTPDLAHGSIADIPEDKVVERLLSDPLWPSELFELYGMRNRQRGRTRAVQRRHRRSALSSG
jgi:hypothetical protein